MKKTVIIVAVLCLVIGVPLLKKFVGDDDAKKVQVETLKNRTIKASILASGNLNHDEEVQLSPEIIGKVKTIFVKEGDKVAKDQLLLQIDDEAYVSATEQSQAAVRMQKIDLERLQAQHKNLLSKWNRQKFLLDKQLVDQQSFDAITLDLSTAEFQVKSGHEQLIQSEALLAQAKNNLAKTRVYSPIDGIVTSLTIKVGETAISGTMNFAASSLMTIANPASLHAEVNVDEADITNVVLGQRAEIVAIAYSNRPISGVVSTIAETAKVAAGRTGLSFAVKIRFDDTNKIKLWPGMSARVEIFTSSDAVKLAAPVQAIVGENNADKDEEMEKNKASKSDRKVEKNKDKKLHGKAAAEYIFVAHNGKARRVAITTGLSDDEYQEIKSIVKDDVKLGDNIIIGPNRTLRYLKDGEKISIDKTKNDDQDDDGK